MKWMLKGIALLMAMILILPTAVFAATSAEITPYASTTLRQYFAFLDVPSGNEIQIWFDVIGTGLLDRIGSSSIYMQRSTDGENWTTVKIFIYTAYPSMMTTNAYDHLGYVSYYGTEGYYYRAQVAVVGVKGSESSTRYIYTDVIKL